MNDERAHVLVLDDDHDTADSMASLLALWGFESRACYAGPAALDAARAWHPHAVLMDLGMPRMDGCEFARRFHAVPGCGAGVLVAVTGHTTAACRARARAAGVDHYLLKPVDPDRLRELLGRAVRPSGAPEGPADVTGFRWRPLVRPGRRPSPVNAETVGQPREWL
jgi:CheY-like chemotaxis protein